MGIYTIKTVHTVSFGKYGLSSDSLFLKAWGVTSSFGILYGYSGAIILIILTVGFDYVTVGA